MFGPSSWPSVGGGLTLFAAADQVVRPTFAVSAVADGGPRTAGANPKPGTTYQPPALTAGGPMNGVRSERLGIAPLAQVMGASVVQVGAALLAPLPPRIVRREGRNRREDPSRWQNMRYGWEQPVVCEVAQLLHAWNLARRHAFRRCALKRLRSEAIWFWGSSSSDLRLILRAALLTSR